MSTLQPLACTYQPCKQVISLQACKGPEDALRVYNTLLGARGGARDTESLQTPVLRLRLLHSTLQLVQTVAVRFSISTPFHLHFIALCSLTSLDIDSIPTKPDETEWWGSH